MKLEIRDSSSSAMRWLTVKKVIIIIAFLWIVKIIVGLLFGTMSTKLDNPDLALHPEQFPFQPQSCIMEDGVCKPYSDAKAPVAAKGLFAHGNSFYLDGRPFRILSGSFHYFRTQPAQWGDRLLKMKAAGLNTVTTYVPWNLNEKTPGAYHFGGRWDLSTFIEQVQKVGLKLIIRPGPYICAEWEFGGLPSWLMRIPNFKIRSSKCKPYITAVENYFSKLLPMLAAFGHKRGGPIIAFQVENEFGSYGDDQDYLMFLRDLYIKYGIEELLFTSDGSEYLKHGSIPGVLATVNFGRNPRGHFKSLENFQPNKPLMVTEFWCGWFDHWGEKHHTKNNTEMEEILNTILSLNASVNFYMFVGGTNFGFWNGANYDNSHQYKPTQTSYDYDAPISETGDITEKFAIVRKAIMKHGLGPVDWVQVPPNTPKASYGFATMEKSLPYVDFFEFLQESTETNPDPLPMEQLSMNNHGGQGYGWILYRTTLTEGNKLRINGEVKDYAQVIIDDKIIKTISWKNEISEIDLPEDNKLDKTLDIFVENTGRVNFVFRKVFEVISHQWKGIKGNIMIDDTILKQWKHIPFDFNYNMRQVLKSPFIWKPYKQHKIPAAYYGTFTIVGQPTDTFLKLEGWGKGIVLINSYNIGRYWTDMGPQKTLYVPGPLLLEGENYIIVFELYKPNDRVEFVEKHILD